MHTRSPSEEGWEVIDGQDATNTINSPQLPLHINLTADKATRIHAHLLIPGSGKPVHNTTVIASQGKIIYIGSPDGIPNKYSKLNAVHVPVLMPGMWECHAHFVGASPTKPIDLLNMGLMNPAEAGARNVRALRDTLYAGYTSCVDLAGYAPELQRVMDEGSILGPTLYGTGAALSMTAGHGDIFEVPLGVARYRGSVNAPGADTTAPFIYCDGVDECRKAVRMNLRRGAKVTKVLTSGGVTSLSDNPMFQQFSDSELKVIVEESNRMGLVCAAHAIGPDGIKAAIRAGFKVIEHGSFLSSDIISSMKEKDVMLVGTISPIQALLDHPEGFPPAMREKAMTIATTHKESYRRAVKAGVKIALGSDLFGGPGSALSPGTNGSEMVYAVEVGGMTPLAAIEAGTAHGPWTLGEAQAPKSGLIKEGFDADFLGLDESPLDDIAVLRTPANIKYIWKGGKLVKGPNVDYWEVLSA